MIGMKFRITKHGYKIVQVLGGRSNVFLFTNGEKNILIDTSPKFLWCILNHRLKKLNISKINYLILTHAHFDHAANSRKIKALYGAEIIIHQSEAANLNTGTNPITNGTNILYKLITKLQYTPLINFLNYEPCRNDYAIDQKFDLNQFGFNAFILHTPGHTIGSASVIIDDEIAIVGDCMFGIFRNSIYPPVAFDSRELIKSWGKLLETNCSVFIPSHGSVNSRKLVEKDFKYYALRILKIEIP